MIPWGLQPEPFLVAAGRKVEIVSCWLPSPHPWLPGTDPRSSWWGNEWMSCPEGLCGPEEVDAYQIPPRNGQIHFLLGF